MCSSKVSTEDDMKSNAHNSVHTIPQVRCVHQEVTKMMAKGH